MKDAWWESAVIYQIYPRSFMDSNGDGVGDLQGIRMKLPYIQQMGYDAIWLSPIYPSPMADFGYDVSDYRGIHHEYGTMEDFDGLVSDCHGMGIKVILDFVPNHCSSEHPWFTSARSSRDSAYRDWFIWHDGSAEGPPPNNWLGAFGGSAWSYDSTTAQYWMHSFLPEQPDLNWENPAVRQEMFETMRFWLDRGVDGFRVDVILRLKKDMLFRDEPVNPAWHKGMDPYDRLLHTGTRNAVGVHEYVKQIRQVVEAYPGKVLIGETYLPIPELMKYYGSNDECHAPFNFGLITSGSNPVALTGYIKDYLSALPRWAFPNWVVANHDVPRPTSPTRFGLKNAAVATLLLYTLPGMITAYYGDEIPLSMNSIPPDRVRDPKVLREGGGKISRDIARTPMQWDGCAHAGFSTVEPWLPISEDYQEVNVECAMKADDSLLHLVRKVIQFRKQFFSYARGKLIFRKHSGTYMDYMVFTAEVVVRVVLNFGDEECQVDRVLESKQTLLLKTPGIELKYLKNGTLVLPAHGGLVYTVTV